MPRKKAPRSNAVQYLPLLPMKDMVVFPRMVVPLMVGRPMSLAAVDECLASGRPLFLVAQRDATVDVPGPEDLYQVGVVATILQSLRMPDNTLKVVVEGMERARVVALGIEKDFTEAAVERMVAPVPVDDDMDGLMRTALNEFEEYVRLSQRIAPEVLLSLRGTREPEVLADSICAYLALRMEERQELLEIDNVPALLERLSSTLMRENELLEIEHKVRDRVREQMERGQREYYLHEQLKAIHQELGTREDGGDEYAELEAMLRKAKMPKDVRQKAMRELARYERMPAMSPEGAVIRTYLEWLADMPWQKRTKDHIDLEEARRVLDEDHYGLTKVKERILEFLAVRKLSRSARGPALCLVGPPGVGKTSLGKSIARAMGRKFVRVSLGGVRDEAEIRGHRRTYIGSLPGRIVQSMKKAGVKNPVFMLDEIDKMSMDFRGDPSSALLEVLDPEQNKDFSDHYLEVDFDLQEVFFITTANSEYEIPGPLHDRMEVVRLSGYTRYEKLHIARQFLVPKQMEQCGLKEGQLTFTDGGIETIIARYTREAGVRELERQIGRVCRKTAMLIVDKKQRGALTVDEKQVLSLLGRPEYSDIRSDEAPLPGVAVGLAWTWDGGDVLHVESIITLGKGGLTLTGHLGDVMKESAQAAYTYLRAHAKRLGIRHDFHRSKDLHVHVPEGAIPKDGPSAGVVMAVSMLSALREQAPAPALAMTGEITLRGRVLEVGGVKEKVLAAHRAGIRTVILPRENEKDLPDLPEKVVKDIEFVLVSEIDEVFSRAFPSAKATARARGAKSPKKAAK